MNTVSVLTVMDKFMFLSYTTVAAAYALTFWMLRLQEASCALISRLAQTLSLAPCRSQEGDKQKRLQQRLYLGTKNTVSVASLCVYIGTCLYLGLRDAKVIVTVFVGLAALVAMGAVADRFGVAERICILPNLPSAASIRGSRLAALLARRSTSNKAGQEDIGEPLGLKQTNGERSFEAQASQNKARDSASGEVLRCVSRIPATVSTGGGVAARSTLH